MPDAPAAPPAAMRSLRAEIHLPCAQHRARTRQTGATGGAGLLHDTGLGHPITAVFTRSSSLIATIRMGLCEPDRRCLVEEGRWVVPAGTNTGSGMARSRRSKPDTAVQLVEALDPACGGGRASTSRLARGGNRARNGRPMRSQMHRELGRDGRVPRRGCPAPDLGSSGAEEACVR